MKIGLIDLGSNTIRLVVFKWDGGSLQKIYNVKKETRAISYVENGVLSDAGIKAVYLSLRELVLIAQAFDVDDLRIFATASLRNITNGKQARETVEKELKLKIDVLSGEEEALFGFDGAKRATILPRKGVSVDIGGGSTEITYFANGVAINHVSLPIGSLNMYLKHIKNIVPSAKEHEKMRADIQQQLAQVDWLTKLSVDNMIGIGGSARAILKIYLEQTGIEEGMYDTIIPTTEITHTSMMTEGKKSAGVKLLLKAVPDRLTTALPGSMIMDEIAQNLKAKNFILSRYGVREGYLFKRVLNKE